MSALARIARHLGAIVTGSDKDGSEAFVSLENEGYEVYLGSDVSFPQKADLVVYTAAIKESDPERVAAGNKVVTRAAFLADICEGVQKTVAVSGTHGKTTVSAMLSCVAAADGMRFSAHVGGVVRNFQNNTFLSGDDLFVTEACEYKDSFLTLSPDVAIVLNVEWDHSDYFESVENLYASFSRFCSRVKKGGAVILGDGVSSHIDICANDDIRIYRYGEDFSFESREGGGFTLFVKGEPPRFFQTSAKGRHNLYNAAVAAFVSLLVGIEEDAVRMGLAAFLGVKRRYEKGRVPQRRGVRLDIRPGRISLYEQQALFAGKLQQGVKRFHPLDIAPGILGLGQRVGADLVNVKRFIHHGYGAGAQQRLR